MKGSSVGPEYMGRRFIATVALVGAGLGGGASAAVGQEVRQSCAASEQVGWIGIAELACNCTLGSRWVFRAEPRIEAIAPGSPAFGQLREGDVIVAVDGHLITTAEGGRRLASPDPRGEVDVAVRRDGRMAIVNLTPAPVCRGRERPVVTALNASTALRLAPGPRAAPPGADTARTAVVVAPGRPQNNPQPAGRITIGQTEIDPKAMLPNAWFGFGISCSSCGWERAPGPAPRMYFREPPRIMSIEPGSPAARVGLRAGDVLTHVDHLDITSTEGGRRFAAISPDEVVQFTYMRGDGRPHTVRMTALRRPGAQAALDAILAQTDTLIRKAPFSPEAATALEAPVAEYYRNLIEQLRTRAEAAATPSPETRFRTLRYQGDVGNTRIEVRGGSDVITTILEQGRDIVIVTGDTQVRIRVSEGTRRR